VYLFTTRSVDLVTFSVNLYAGKEVKNLDLTLTKRGDYTVRAAISLAKAYPSGGYRKIREVAEEMDLPLRYTPQILNLLSKAGIAEARAGQQGGYRLRRAPEDVTLLDVVEAAEGPLRSERCTLRGGPCHWEDVCPLHVIWEESHRSLSRVLESKSLASVLAIDASLEAGEVVAPEDSHRSRARAKK
jgi:Rrf2 family transcriptional regulator, iron-sulfur cluster assembly transcription factor